MKNLTLTVIGKNVENSLSPSVHEFIAQKLGYSVNYKKISIAENDFDGKIEKLFSDFDGFNVTIPYKIPVMAHLEKLVGDAEVLGAVNTVKTAGRQGFNTDGDGFVLSLKAEGIDVKNTQTLVLGAGGAGRCVAKKLSGLGASVDIFDRHFDKALQVSNSFNGINAVTDINEKPYFFIVNATGCGMRSIDDSPAPISVLSQCEVAYDLIYSPPKSKFLRFAEESGKKIINGFPMLFYQAYFSECIYSDLPLDFGVARELYFEYLKVKK